MDKTKNNSLNTPLETVIDKLRTVEQSCTISSQGVFDMAKNGISVRVLFFQITKMISLKKTVPMGGKHFVVFVFPQILSITFNRLSLVYPGLLITCKQKLTKGSLSVCKSEQEE